jgi:hypothetical protein
MPRFPWNRKAQKKRRINAPTIIATSLAVPQPAVIPGSPSQSSLVSHDDDVPADLAVTRHPHSIPTDTEAFLHVPIDNKTQPLPESTATEVRDDPEETEHVPLVRIETEVPPAGSTNSETLPDNPIPMEECPDDQDGLYTFADPKTASVEFVILSPPGAIIEPVADVCFFSIVAVHGLAGHYKTSWEDDGKLWLKDPGFLPSQVPNTRIMSFGYKSSVTVTGSVADIEDVAHNLLNRLNDARREEQAYRPVVFICHCLGGIVVKKVCRNYIRTVGSLFSSPLTINRLL